MAELNRACYCYVLKPLLWIVIKNWHHHQAPKFVDMIFKHLQRPVFVSFHCFFNFSSQDKIRIGGRNMLCKIVKEVETRWVVLFAREVNESASVCLEFANSLFYILQLQFETAFLQSCNFPFCGLKFIIFYYPLSMIPIKNALIFSTTWGWSESDLLSERECYVVDYRQKFQAKTLLLQFNLVRLNVE